MSERSESDPRKALREAACIHCGTVLEGEVFSCCAALAQAAPSPEVAYWRDLYETCLATTTRLAQAAPPSGLDVEPEALEAKAGKMLVEAARLRLARGGLNDAHEVRHLYAAIQYGNSDDENDGCRLDTQHYLDIIDPRADTLALPDTDKE